jgi:tetratricopeptide (TPR) repeat protein
MPAIILRTRLAFVVFSLFPSIAALLLTTTGLQAAQADELIAMGDTFYARLQTVSCGHQLWETGTFESNREKFEAVHIIKDAVDKAIRLDPRNDWGWHVLGRWHEGLAEVDPVRRAMAQIAFGKLPDSTHQEAATCFEKAIALNPNRPMHYIELGLVYAQMGRTDDARRSISTGLSMPNTEKDDPEVKRQGQEVLAKLR